MLSFLGLAEWSTGLLVIIVGRESLKSWNSMMLLTTYFHYFGQDGIVQVEGLLQNPIVFHILLGIPILQSCPGGF